MSGKMRYQEFETDYNREERNASFFICTKEELVDINLSRLPKGN